MIKKLYIFSIFAFVIFSCSSKDLKQKDVYLTQMKKTNGEERRAFNTSKPVILTLHSVNGVKRARVNGDIKKLDLSNRNLTKIDGLERLHNLESLKLSYNRLTNVDGLNKLKNLRGLDLSHNKITWIDGLSELSELEWLYMYNNRMNRIEGLDKFRKLKWLFLDGNPLSDDEYIKARERYPHIKIIGEAEKGFVPKMVVLVFHMKDDVEMKVVNSKIKSFSLYNREVTEIDGLDKLINLEYLTIKRTKLKKIEGLGKLVKLIKLELSHNRLTEIEGLDKLVNLKYLYLGDNRLSRIDGLDRLPNLKTKSIYPNPFSVKKRARSRFLDKDHVEIFLTDNSFAMRKVVRRDIKKLNLEHRRLIKIEGLEQLTGLEELTLANNRLYNLEWLAGLVNLKKLDLSNNKLEDIRRLDKLVKLENLNLRYNDLEEIMGLDKLLKLRYINISHNKLANPREVSRAVKSKRGCLIESYPQKRGGK